MNNSLDSGEVNGHHLFSIVLSLEKHLFVLLQKLSMDGRIFMRPCP